MSEEMNDILGYGKVVKVMGVKDGNEEMLDFHLTPVSLKDMPELQGLLDKFFKLMENKTIGTPEAMQVCAKIIHLSMRKFHPKYTTENILNIFSLGGIAKIIGIVMDVNDFLSEMGKIQELAQAFQVQNQEQK